MAYLLLLFTNLNKGCPSFSWKVMTTMKHKCNYIAFEIWLGNVIKNLVTYLIN